MKFVSIQTENAVATITLNRDKVHALNHDMMDQIREAFENAAGDDTVRAVILTGTGSFFSFGLDVPEIYDYTPEQCTEFLVKFCDLYTYMYLFPKPVVAAINGHAIAGGCILATTCDYRMMVGGKAKIALNEITFGSSLFAGNVAILKALVGQANAEKIIFGGKMYIAEDAEDLGLVDQVVSENKLMAKAVQVATEMAEKSGEAFAALKRLSREPIVDEYSGYEVEGIERFVKIWYSPSVRKNLKDITIR